MEMNCAKYFVSLVIIALVASSKTTNDTFQEYRGQQAVWSVFMDVATEMIGKAKNTSIICHDTDGKRKENEALMSYLEIADNMIKKAKMNVPTCDNCTIIQQKILDCSDLLHMDQHRSGVYTISPLKRVTGKKTFNVYCDMDTDGGGWTVIQRRGDFHNPVDYFYKDWKSYKEGFGDLEKEFWLGNDNIFALSNQGSYSVRFDLKDIDNNARYAQYETFWIDDENKKYTLHISQYSGDAGDSMMYHNNMKFTTKDQDNDEDEAKNCAHWDKGGWWYKYCFEANLNGENLRVKVDKYQGLIWKDWKGWYESLASTEIKIRPKNFRA